MRNLAAVPCSIPAASGICGATDDLVLNNNEQKYRRKLKLKKIDKRRYLSDSALHLIVSLIVQFLHHLSKRIFLKSSVADPDPDADL
jgi:hypothetical protein